jgi:hypothetical protein
VVEVVADVEVVETDDEVDAGTVVEVDELLVDGVLELVELARTVEVVDALVDVVPAWLVLVVLDDVLPGTVVVVPLVVVVEVEVEVGGTVVVVLTTVVDGAVVVSSVVLGGSVVVGGAVTTTTGGAVATVGGDAWPLAPGGREVLTPAGARAGTTGCSFQRRLVPQISWQLDAPSMTSFTHSDGHVAPRRNEPSVTTCRVRPFEIPTRVRTLSSYEPAAMSGTMTANWWVLRSGSIPVRTASARAASRPCAARGVNSTSTT